eukprot:scaffold51851_cov59-Phaeocystis_antarctica.AAC.2
MQCYVLIYLLTIRRPHGSRRSCGGCRSCAPRSAEAELAAGTRLVSNLKGGTSYTVSTGYTVPRGSLDLSLTHGVRSSLLTYLALTYYGTRPRRWLLPPEAHDAGKRAHLDLGRALLVRRGEGLRRRTGTGLSDAVDESSGSSSSGPSRVELRERESALAPSCACSPRDRSTDLRASTSRFSASACKGQWSG